MINKDILLAIKARAFEQQLDFIKDKSKRKALFVGRRAGKSTSIAIYMLLAALTNPGVRITYFGLTAGSAEDTMYPILLGKEPGQEAGILLNYLKESEYKYNMTERLLEFSNGASIKFAGVDVNYKEIDKVLGSKQYMIIIDECQNQTQDLEKIINKKAQQCVSDYLTKGGGQIILAGTAGDYRGKHYWYRINTDPTLGWSIHHWEHDQNPHMKQQKKIEQDNFLKQYGPDYIKTAWWIQQYECQWITDKNVLIYRYDQSNLLNSPSCIDSATNQRIPMPSNEFLTSATYILGIDLGYNDPTALTIVAYNLKFSNKLYVIETFNKSNMLVQEVASKIKQLDNKYHFSYMVGDSSSLQVFETIKQNYSLPIEKANRSGKLSHQLVVNSDLQTKNIVIMPGNDELINQLQSCIWDRSAFEEGRYVEDPSFKNDIADSFLYAHNFSRHLWFKEPKPILTIQESFVQSILQGEKKFNKQMILQGSKERYNPYQKTWRN